MEKLCQNIDEPNYINHVLMCLVAFVIYLKGNTAFSEVT